MCFGIDILYHAFKPENVIGRVSSCRKLSSKQSQAEEKLETETSVSVSRLSLRIKAREYDAAKNKLSLIPKRNEFLQAVRATNLKK